MKFSEFVSEEKLPGTYVGVKFSTKTNHQLVKFMKSLNIPSHTLHGDLHCTLIYSKKPCPDFEPSQDNYPIKAKFKGYDIFGEDNNCLVMLLGSPELKNRNKEITEEHDATSDYDYHPHITLSQDIGNLDISKLPDYKDDITIELEYSEPIDESK